MGIWEINLPEGAIHHGDLYKLNVYWDGGQGERIPAWATRVVQDEQTKILVHRYGPQRNLINSRKRLLNLTQVLC